MNIEKYNNGLQNKKGDFEKMKILDARHNDNLKPYEKIPCEHCGKYKTYEGHDGCLKELIGLANACCGHGNINQAYVQFYDGTSVHGEDAIKIQDILKKYSYKKNNEKRLAFLKGSVKFHSEMDKLLYFKEEI